MDDFPYFKEIPLDDDEDARKRGVSMRTWVTSWLPCGLLLLSFSSSIVVPRRIGPRARRRTSPQHQRATGSSCLWREVSPPRRCALSTKSPQGMFTSVSLFFFFFFFFFPLFFLRAIPSYFPLRINPHHQTKGVHRGSKDHLGQVMTLSSSLEIFFLFFTFFSSFLLPFSPNESKIIIIIKPFDLIITHL